VRSHRAGTVGGRAGGPAVIWLDWRDWRWRSRCHYRSRLSSVDIEGEVCRLKVAVTTRRTHGHRTGRPETVSHPLQPCGWIRRGRCRQGHHRAAIVGDRAVAPQSICVGWPDWRWRSRYAAGPPCRVRATLIVKLLVLVAVPAALSRSPVLVAPPAPSPGFAVAELTVKLRSPR